MPCSLQPLHLFHRSVIVMDGRRFYRRHAVHCLNPPMDRAFAGTAAVATATAVALGGFIAEAAQPLAESLTCADVGRNLCPPESIPQIDQKDPELERAPAERNRMHGDGSLVGNLFARGVSLLLTTASTLVLPSR